MKTRNFKIQIAVLSFCTLAASIASAAEPTPCSIAVGVTTRTGTFRTWTNALETLKLQEKGFPEVCQDDAILNLSDKELENMTEEKAQKLLKCETEFKLELLFYADNPKKPEQGLTRNVTIFTGGKAIFRQDYLPNPSSIGSLKILKTIPTCDELHALVAKKATEATGN